MNGKRKNPYDKNFNKHISSQAIMIFLYDHLGVIILSCRKSVRTVYYCDFMKKKV